MFIDEQAFEIYKLHRAIVNQDKRLKQYFDHSPNSLYASIRNSRGHVLANLHVSDGDDNAKAVIQAYQQQLSILLMREVA